MVCGKTPLPARISPRLIRLSGRRPEPPKKLRVFTLRVAFVSSKIGVLQLMPASSGVADNPTSIFPERELDRA
jgi:hypothetical protein